MKRKRWLQNHKRDSLLCQKCEKLFSTSRCKECEQHHLCKECLQAFKHEQILANAVGQKNMKEIFNPNRRQTIENRIPGYLPDLPNNSRPSPWS